MGEIVDFNDYTSDNDVMLFSGEVMEEDEYLQLLTMNLISNMGYTCDKEGISVFQKSIGMEHPTGIFTDENFEALIRIVVDKYTDIDMTSAIKHYEDAKLAAINKKKNEKRGYIIAIIWLLSICFFCGWGIIGFIKFIMGLILNLF